MCFAQYIGSKETDQRADEVAKQGISDFWTPENHYRWSTSRYGGHVSASVEPVHPSRLLLCGMISVSRSAFHNLLMSLAIVSTKRMP